MFYKICSDISKLGPHINPIHNFYRLCSHSILKKFLNFFIRRLYQTHYEVLNLPRSCTSKEIKNAFIKLSKEYHPDVTNNQKSHARFLLITEAYKVLGKTESRHNYDLGLRVANENPNIQRHDHTETYYEQRGRNPEHDPAFWINRNMSEDKFYKNAPYYGINGIPRLPNGLILMFCVIFACVGVGIQYIAVTRSHTFRRDELIKRSLETEKALNATKEAATVNGNMVQLAALRTKLLGNQIKETDNK